MDQQLVVAQPQGLAPQFSLQTYVIKRPFWTFLGRTFKVYDPQGKMIMYVRHPMKWRDAITVYTDENMTQALCSTQARAAIALNPTYDVKSQPDGTKLGVFKAKGLKSILRDEWEVLDANDQPIGLMREDGAAILRRIRIIPFMTGKWHIEIGGQTVATIRQKWRMFIKEFHLDISMGAGKIDPRFAMLGAVLALLKEVMREDSNRG